MIELVNVSKSYGTKQVLHNINLNLSKGKVYGIVGENGAGKTTLFKCMAGLENYNGIIQSAFTPIKDYLGLLPTNPVFMSRMTAWEYLKLLRIARNIHEEDFEAKNIFDLPLNQYANTYSTGMQKKLALMGILLQENEFFILDEPFNGVDIHSNMLITAIIKGLKQQGKTILIASHIFSTLKDTCDEIHLLKEGEIVKSVQKDGFGELDIEMQRFVLGDSLERLDLKKID